MMRKRRAGVLAVALVVALGGLSAGCAAAQPDSEPAKEPAAGFKEDAAGGVGIVNEVTDQQGVAFTLYVGLADAETGAQELSFAEAKRVATPLVSAVGDGYTVLEAQGGFTSDEGELVENGTLVYTGIHAGEQDVLALIESLKAELHVESIYVTCAEEGYAIFGGTIAPAA